MFVICVVPHLLTDPFPLVRPPRGRCRGCETRLFYRARTRAAKPYFLYREHRSHRYIPQRRTAKPVVPPVLLIMTGGGSLLEGGCC